MALSRLPSCSGREAAKIFVTYGWSIRRDREHIVLTKIDSLFHLSIPNHREVDRALLHDQIKRAGLTDQLFRQRFDELF